MLQPRQQAGGYGWFANYLTHPFKKSNTLQYDNAMLDLSENLAMYTNQCLEETG
jgi:hypothetical protein